MTVADTNATARALGIRYKEVAALPRRVLTERQRHLDSQGVYRIHGSILLLGTSPEAAWLEAVQKRRKLIRGAIQSTQRTRANGIKLGVLSVDQIAELEGLEQVFSSALPVSVCPWCKLLPIECSGCLGNRWVSEAVFEAVGREYLDHDLVLFEGLPTHITKARKAIASPL